MEQIKAEVEALRRADHLMQSIKQDSLPPRPPRQTEENEKDDWKQYHIEKKEYDDFKKWERQHMVQI